MVNVFYYSDFIYKRSSDFQLEQKYNKAMDALPQKVCMPLEESTTERFIEHSFRFQLDHRSENERIFIA